MLALIQARPVRFVFLVEAILGGAIVFGLPLDEVQYGAIMLVVNAILAFVLDSFTTPVLLDGTPVNSNYQKVNRADDELPDDYEPFFEG